MSDPRKVQASGRETGAAIAATDRLSLRDPSTAVFCLLVTLAALLAWGAPRAAGDIHGGWSDRYGAFSHGYLVLALSLFIALRSLRAAPLPALRPWWPALVPLALLILTLVVAEVLFIGPVRVALLPLALLAAIALAMGQAVSRRLAWAIAFLYFGLPVWGFLNPLLQQLTIFVAGRFLLGLGVPAEIEGNLVYLPSGTFEIAWGCAGLNYFTVALTVAAVASMMLLDDWRSRLRLFVAAGLAGLVANWVRVTALIVIGHVTQMQHYLVRVDHLTFGWVVFAVAMLPVYVLVARAPRADAMLPAAVVPSLSGDGQYAARRVGLAVLAAAGLLVVPRFAGDGPRKGTPAVPPSFAAAPSSSFPSGWQPSFIGATEFRFVAAPDGSREVPRVEAYVAWYPHQTREARPSPFDNSVAGTGWRVARSQQVERASAPALVQELEGVDGNRRRLIWTWVESGGRSVTTKLELRLRDLQAFLHGRRDAAVLAVATDCSLDCDAARQRLEAFLATDPLR